jgi:hypothetical protein
LPSSNNNNISLKAGKTTGGPVNPCFTDLFAHHPKLTVDIIDIAVFPVLTGFQGTNHRVAGLVKMRGGVLTD